MAGARVQLPLGGEWHAMLRLLRPHLCRGCLDELDGVAYRLQAVKCDPGVADQPMGLEETALGAKNRAEAALAAVGGAALGIGLESGLVVVGDELLDFCACVVFDGERTAVGLSSMWTLPPKVAASIRAGRGYNAAFEECTGNPANRNGGGVRRYSQNATVPDKTWSSWMRELLT